MKNLLPIFPLLLLLTSCRQELSGVDAIVKQEMEDHHIPGLAMAVIRSGKVVHLKAYGYSDLEKQMAADTQTPFHIASVSKVVIGVGVFKLVESGQMDLEADINHYLPFQVANPWFPTEKITVKQLLNHRSGIRDDNKLLDPIWSITKGDSPILLKEYLESYLVPNGEMYGSSHYASGPDRHGFAYSNIGYALLGLMIEHTVNTDLESFFQQHVFGPLGMENTSWFLKNLDSARVAKPYTYSVLTGHTFHGHNGYPDYPAGQLRTSIADFGRFIQAYLNGAGGSFILKPATVNTITPNPRLSQDGFYTWLLTAIDNQLYYTHGGGDIGVSSQVVVDIYHRNAVIVFINGEFELVKLAQRVAGEVF